MPSEIHHSNSTQEIHPNLDSSKSSNFSDTSITAQKLYFDSGRTPHQKQTIEQTKSTEKPSLKKEYPIGPRELPGLTERTQKRRTDGEIAKTLAKLSLQGSERVPTTSRAETFKRVKAPDFLSKISENDPNYQDFIKNSIEREKAIEDQRKQAHKQAQKTVHFRPKERNDHPESLKGRKPPQTEVLDQNERRELARQIKNNRLETFKYNGMRKEEYQSNDITEDEKKQITAQHEKWMETADRKKITEKTGN